MCIIGYRVSLFCSIDLLPMFCLNLNFVWIKQIFNKKKVSQIICRVHVALWPVNQRCRAEHTTARSGAVGGSVNKVMFSSWKRKLEVFNIHRSLKKKRFLLIYDISKQMFFFFCVGIYNLIYSITVHVCNLSSVHNVAGATKPRISKMLKCSGEPKNMAALTL